VFGYIFRGFYNVITVTVNGDSKTLGEATNLQAFLTALELDPKKLAVERNLVIVPKSTFANVMLADGDTLEIVHFIGGG